MDDQPNSRVISFHHHNAPPPYQHTRNPVTHSGRGFRAKFASSKNGRMVRCESLLEMDSLFLFEFAREVVSFEEQPVTIWHSLNNRRRRYTPDFGVKWLDGTRWYVEVKPSQKLSDEANREKFASIGAHFAAQGDTFVTLTEKQIRDTRRLKEVQALLRIRRKAVPLAVEDALRQLSPLGTRTFREAERIVGKSAVLDLLAMRHFVCDLSNGIHSDTVLSTFTRGDDHALFL